jgi:hypothetical protein
MMKQPIDLQQKFKDRIKGLMNSTIWESTLASLWCRKCKRDSVSVKSATLVFSLLKFVSLQDPEL